LPPISQEKDDSVSGNQGQIQGTPKGKFSQGTPNKDSKTPVQLAD